MSWTEINRISYTVGGHSDHLERRLIMATFLVDFGAQIALVAVILFGMAIAGEIHWK
jgi:hypothetical protein